MVQQDQAKEETNIEPKAVSILLVGDPGVGKTSLIYSLINNEFVPHVLPRIRNVTLPAKVTPDHVPLKIVDFSEREQYIEELKELIEEADVICIVYSAEEPESLARVKSYWVKIIRQYQTSIDGRYKPIIVAANHTGSIGVHATPVIPPAFREFEEIEAFLDVSALTLANVVELFYLAQKSVLYPIAPLFNPHSRTLTTECRSALIDIFKLCDLDGDGLMSDHELNLFHENCFGIPLQKDALEDLKSIIKQSTMDGISNNAISQSGFLFLHTFSIDKGRHSFTWRVLRKFNYDNQMNKKSELQNLTEEENRKNPTNDASNSFQENSYNQCKSSFEMVNENVQHTSHLDLSWIRENSKMIKAGFGLTVATIISMVALKYLVQGGSRV